MENTVKKRRNIIKQINLTPLPSTYVKAPIIDECPINIECRVISIQEIGDHDLFIGEVLAIHADVDKIDSDGNIDFEKLDLLVYLTKSYWSLGKKLGNLGYTSIKK